MSTKYVEHVQERLDACLEFQAGRLTIDNLQQALWGLSQVVVAADESDLRNFLQQVEGRLDIARFTDPDSGRTIVGIVGEVEERLRLALADD